ncbi:MAG: PP2C family protein-serine/threonine phosphatase [Ignavibacteriales bacterium]|nr:MAG: PP2C family protein-serine/threonine phosphatase [Ignavibacteriales bacterium]
MQKKIILITGVLLTIIISFTLFKILYNDVSPLGGLSLQFDNLQVKEKAIQFLKEQGIEIKDRIAEVKLKRNNELQEFIQQKYGVEKSNELSRAGFPVYYWNARLLNESDEVVISNNSQKELKQGSERDIFIKYALDGSLLEFENEQDDSSALEQLEIEDARREAELFISRINPSLKLIPDSAYYKMMDKSTLQDDQIFIFQGQTVIPKVFRNDYEFKWTAFSSVTNKKINLIAIIAGTRLSRFSITYETDKIPDSTNYFTTISIILFIIVITILLIITAYRRIKASELGFKAALWVGLLYAVSFGFTLYSEVNLAKGWQSLIPLVFGGLFLGGAAILTWAISESLGRDVWKEKFIGSDLFFNGHLLNSRLSESILRGIQFGTALAAFWLILLFISGSVMNYSNIQNEAKDLTAIHSLIPAFTLLNNHFFEHMFMIPVFFIFTVSGLRRRISNDIVLLIVCGIIWGAVNESDIKPIYLGVILNSIIGILLTYVFYKFDLVTAAITVFTVFPLLGGFVFLNVEGGAYSQPALVLILIYAGIVLLAITGYLTKDKLSDLDSITPVFVKNINERQRMQRELEIARDVQMSFLPKSNPDFKGLDVAAKCYPALEVGGDYYDFVRISENKLGVIIGDVSGKGTQAAFYMTLTKGFLKAISKTSDSPSEVLKLMNELFYDNVERGTFISMIYGVFDNEKKNFRLARAGHNPVIVRNSSKGNVETLNPTGLALGLEKGTLFSKAISEVEINYSPNDIFVLYTDGFTEAMNKKQEEFTEERLLDSVHKLSGFSAEESIQKIHKEVSSFIGKAPQHDDMTIVIVKVNEG